MKKISVVLPVLAPTPFLRDMTEFALRTLREHADDKDFELIVVEAGEPYFDPERFPVSTNDPELYARAGLIDRYISFKQKVGCVRELNAGIDAASGEFILSTGNDVFVPPHWDTELLKVFSERKDAGLASLSAYERGSTIGPDGPLDMLVEGWYSPFLMFRKGDRFDESYKKIYQDSDMIMRVYERGQVPYRSCRAHVHHLLRMTSDRVEPERHKLELAQDERLFYSRWGKSPRAAFGIIRSGQYGFGREHASFLNPVGRPDHPANRRIA